MIPRAPSSLMATQKTMVMAVHLPITTVANESKGL
jgi:hypothetical protein